MKAISIYDMTELARIAEAFDHFALVSEKFHIGFGVLDVMDDNDNHIGSFLWDDKSEQVVFKPGKAR